MQNSTTTQIAITHFQHAKARPHTTTNTTQNNITTRNAISRVQITKKTRFQKKTNATKTMQNNTTQNTITCPTCKNISTHHNRHIATQHNIKYKRKFPQCKITISTQQKRSKTTQHGKIQ